MAKQTFTTGQVLTAAQMTSLQQTAMLGGAASAKTASYTLVAADAGTSISMSNASATTITVNTALFAAGDTVQITNLGAGVCTITAGTATVNTSASLALAQYESGTLTFTSTSAAIFIKGAGASAASGGMTLISTTTLTGSSVSLSSIPQTYKHLFFVYNNIGSSTGALCLKINNNSNYYNYSTSVISGSTLTDGTAGSGTTDGLVLLQAANTFYGTTWIGRYSESMVKAVTTQGIRTDGKTILASGFWNDSTAISSLQFQGGSMSGTVYMYGVS